MGRCHSASIPAMLPKHCKKHRQQVQKHPQKVQIFSTNSRLDLSVTLPVLQLGDSHCAAVELDGVALATFGLEHQQPMFQASSIHRDLRGAGKSLLPAGRVCVSQ